MRSSESSGGHPHFRHVLDLDLHGTVSFEGGLRKGQAQLRGELRSEMNAGARGKLRAGRRLAALAGPRRAMRSSAERTATS